MNFPSPKSISEVDFEDLLRYLEFADTHVALWIIIHVYLYHDNIMINKDRKELVTGIHTFLVHCGLVRITASDDKIDILWRLVKH